LSDFGLTTKDDVNSWVKKANESKWKEEVLEGQDAFMIKFFEEENRKSNRRALLELPFFPIDPNKDSKIAASNLRFLSALPYSLDDPEVTKSNKQTLRELPSCTL
jgi:hypothetical protein